MRQDSLSLRLRQSVGHYQAVLELIIIMKNDQDIYTELCYYTQAHGEAPFIHQHVVDAFAAQTAKENDKPIKLAFALVGLYLHVVSAVRLRLPTLWMRLPDPRGTR
jgi:hypothetical protein